MSCEWVVTRSCGCATQTSDLRRALVSGEEPHADVSRDDRLVGVVDKAGQILHLLMNVLLVLEDVGLSRQHGWAWIVIGRNIDDGQLASVGKDATGLGGNAAAGKTGHFVEAVHDGNKVKRIILEDSLLGIALGIDWAAGPAKAILHQIGTIDEGHEQGESISPKLGEDPGNVADATHMVGQPPGHADHLGAGIDADDGLGIGKGLLEGTGGDANSAAQVANSGAAAPGRTKDVIGQLVGYHGPNILALVGGIIDGTGGEGGDEGVESAEEAGVAKDVNAVVEPVKVVVLVGRQIRCIIDDIDGRARQLLREGLFDDVLVRLLGFGVDLEGIGGANEIAASKGSSGQDDELGRDGEFHVLLCVSGLWCASIVGCVRHEGFTI